MKGCSGVRTREREGRMMAGRLPVGRLPRFLFSLSLFAFLTFAVGLTACSVPAGIAKFTAADAANASAMAEAAAAFDPTAAARVPCWQAWGTLAGALAKGGQSAGLLSAAEAKLEADAAFESPVCQAVAGRLLLNLIP